MSSTAATPSANPDITTAQTDVISTVITSASTSSSSSFMSTLTNGLQKRTTSVIVAAISPSKRNQSTPHSIFIETQLLPIIYKLQKEVGWRKYKDCQAPLQEVVLALKVFQQETWPPVSVNNKSTVDDTVTSSTDVEADDVRKKAMESRPTQAKEDGSGAILSPPVHDAIIMTMNVLIQILQDDYSIQQMNKYTIKPIEMTLEAIANIVTQQRYLYGSATGISTTTSMVKSRTNSIDTVASAAIGSSNVPALSYIDDDTTTSSSNQIISNLLVRLMDAICKMSESTNDMIQVAVLNTITTIMTCTKLLIHDNCMLRTMKCTFHIYLVTKSLSTKQLAKRSILDIMKVIFFRMEAYDALHRNSGTDTKATTIMDHSSMESESTATTIGTTTTSSSTSGDLRAVPSEGSIEAAPTRENSKLAPSFPSQFHADAYYLFRSLCKLSSKELPADITDEQQRKHAPGRILLNALSSSTTDPTELNSKILSLELILVALEQYVGDAFFVAVPQSGPSSTSSSDHSDLGGNGSIATAQNKFIYLVQHYLCGSLLKNCVSNHTKVAYISQKIFFVLVYKFKGHLKQDIEVFMSNVFFRVLESSNTSFKQKALVLVSFRSICQDPNLLTQIFLNYDCDFDAMNLYKDIVHMLTKVGGKATSMQYNSQVISKRDIEQEFELSLGAIECLVTILKAFLRALNLPAGSSTDDNNNSTDIDSAGSRIRVMLQLDSALAYMQQTPDDSTNDTDLESVSGVASNDNDTSGNPLPPALTSLPSHSSFSSDKSPTTDTAALSASEDTELDGISTDTKADSSTSTVVESTLTNKIVDAFDRKRNAEQNFQIGIVKFTMSLKTGLQFFIDQGFVECDAKRIALFFIANKDRLDKTQMGEALGREPDAAFVKDKGIEADKGGPGFWFRILHYYADALDFTDCMFDEAIRLFLSGFRLPGEAQKIDRIMEKFAERYTSQNPKVFPSSDTAFILGFSVIMLNTDLHNPSIKPEKRMTIDSFLRNNKGIGENGSNLPDELLKGIFERIKERPFSLKEDDAARERAGAQKNSLFDTSAFFDGSNSLFGVSADERKRENFRKEREEMMAATEQLIRRRPGKSSNSVSSITSDHETKFNDDVSPAEVVKPMFDVTWGPMLGILSQVLECADDERSVAVCLSGFVFAIRLAAQSGMTLVRDTFVSSLAKFTYLGSIKEMKRKNVDSTRTLLSVAVLDGEYLGESWLPVLQCMSQLARLRLSASGLESDDSFLMSDISKNSSNSKVDNSKHGKVRPAGPGEAAREADESNGKAVLEAVHEILIDKVFSSTVHLSAKSLTHFVQQLIAVSSAEIAGGSKSVIAGIEASKVPMEISSSGSGLSIFSLQRLVDVADYNMDIRPRLVWAQVWELMSEYFVRAALHENRMVSIFAIDSLKQLSLKFLQKPELSEFNFQCTFLRPFLIVMEDRSSRDEIRELILQCIDNIIRAKSQFLKSGWKVVFSILTLSARDPIEKIEYFGLSILQRVLDEHLDDIFIISESISSEAQHDELSSLDKRFRNSSAEDFVSLCKASLSFVQTEETDSLRPFGLSMRAFCHLAIYADLLGSNRVLPPLSGSQTSEPQSMGYTYNNLSETESLGLVLWRPMFEGLANGVKSTAKTSASGVGCLIQRGSVLTLRSILLRHGHRFSTPQLDAILRETVVPAIQNAAECDKSHVSFLTSESPSLSSIDFLAFPSPLPPDHDDQFLQKFSALNTVPKRAIGPAELLLEASFTDLRHGGDGDLRKAYLLAQKSAADDAKRVEQAFPDSWIATTAPIALGLLTDIASEFVICGHQESQITLWPLIADQYKLWMVGRMHPLEGRALSDIESSWFPCEALVRIAANELLRLPRRVFAAPKFFDLETAVQANWVSHFIGLFSSILMRNSQIEKMNQQNLIVLRRERQLDSTNDDESVDTPYGSGHVMSVRNDLHTDSVSQLTKVIPITIIELDYGAILFQPVSGPPTQSYAENVSKDIPSEVSIPEAYWVHAVPTLKICCVSAYCLQQSLLSSIDAMIPLASHADTARLYASLKEAQQCAASAVIDHDVSMAFQDALLKDWGDGIQIPSEDSETISRLSLQHGSATFFLSQESGAVKCILHLLSTLFLSFHGIVNDWDRAEYAEPLLVVTMVDVLNKFLDSEKRDGHLVDYNDWRKVGEHSGKVALYCTSFATVVTDILKTIRSMRHADFDKYKDKYFLQLCALIRMNSSDIRQMVHEIMIVHLGQYVGVFAEPLQPKDR